MKFTIYFLLFLLAFNANAQSHCDCAKNLQFLEASLEKLPVFKYTEDFSAYRSALAKAKSNPEIGNTVYGCFQKMSDILVTLNDRHNALYSEPLYNIKAKDTVYEDFPEFKGDIDSLKQDLQQRSFDEMEGIYTRKDYIVGVIADGNDFKMINLAPTNKIWKNGEIIGRLLKYEENKFLASAALLSNKQLLNRPVHVEHGRISKYGLKKNTNLEIFNTVKTDETFQYKNWNATTYLRIGSFSGYNPVLKNAESFYKELEEKPITKNLIIDLRDNGGGGDRNSDILYKYLKKNYRNANIFVLINENTASNAEQFALKLQKFDNTSILGSSSSGTIAYELGKTYEFPCYKINGFFTFKGFKKYVPYETIGLKPDIMLETTSSWIEQTKNYISKSN